MLYSTDCPYNQQGNDTQYEYDNHYQYELMLHQDIFIVN
ncbi:hypothetical protein yaldo0001_29560 [Yersinia aldovae ATCC 35236]|nr:hypothetical protein yaldo0001_29560 [Yersinia aldovae ATCC 35236]